MACILCMHKICFAQNLATARSSSHYTLIYSITNDEARQLYFNNKWRVDEKFFHSLYDSYLSDSSYKKKLPVGHYLFVKANEATLTCEVKSVDNVDMKILNNHRDMLLVFLSDYGKEIDSVSLRIDARHIPFNKRLKAYRLAKSNRRGVVEATYKGHISFLSINRRYNNSSLKRIKRRVLGTFPINHLASPFYYVTRSIKGLLRPYPHIYPPGIYYRVQRLFQPKHFNGFVVLNKPIYRPGDTVKLKAFINTKKGRPIKKTLDIRLSSNKLGTIKSYRPGAYTFDFVLTDSLKLKLDNEYWFLLDDGSDNDYPSGNFRYEEYELKQNTFSLWADETTLNKPATIHLKGVDSNDLPLYDVQVDVIVKATNIIKPFEKEIFIADTLWKHHLKLNPIDDNKIVLPDSIFPCALIDYDVQAIFTNADNERTVKTLPLRYNALAHSIDVTLQNDTINFISSYGEENASLEAFNTKDQILYRKSVHLPYHHKIEPLLKGYQLKQGGQVLHTMNLSDEDASLQLQAGRTVDSLFMEVVNPRKLVFRYQLFKDNRIIDQGLTSEYHSRKSANANEIYHMSMHYIWGGEAKELNYDLPFSKKKLNITIDHPSTVFPGQTIDMKVLVKDAFGKPVSNTDLTAYAITKKFHEVSGPTIPNYEHFKSRVVFNEFTKGNVAKSITQHIQFDFWKKKLGLDSMEFYHFLYPQNGMYLHYMPTSENETQVAPYIILDGIVQQVFYIEIDHKLSFYDQVSTSEPYAFKTRDGEQQISIRLRDKFIMLSDVPVCKGEKLIISVDLNHLPANTISVERPTTFTPQEVDKLWPRFATIERISSQSSAYVAQDGVYRLLPSFNQWENNRYNDLVGPLLLGPVTYATSSFSLNFDFAMGKSYRFFPSLVDRESINLKSRFQYRQLNNGFSSIKFRDEAITLKQIERLWKAPEVARITNFRKMPSYNYAVTKQSGSLKMQSNPKLESVLATFIINLDQPDEYYIYPGRYAEFSPLRPGLYQAVVILDDETYIKTIPLFIKAYGKTFYEVTDEKINAADTFSMEVIHKLTKWSSENTYVEQARMMDMQQVRELYYSEANNASYFSNGKWVEGFVKDNNEIIPGVNVLVKGTTIGTTTDANGFFRIFVPYGSSLVISFIGYVTQEIDTNQKQRIDISLEADVQSLQEIVVVGYGSQQKRDLVSAISTISGDVLQGRVAGVQISGAPGAADSVTIRIRGISAFNTTSPPIVIIDGELRRLDDIEPGKIKSIETLKSEKAVALYGSRAANGIIIISTKEVLTTQQLRQTKLPVIPQLISLDEETPGSSLRKNFRDYAFWQPKLVTNKNGEATFKTTFPDDITGWRINVVGIASRKRNGQISSEVQAFKPLSAQLKLPNFLIEGDQAIAIGKITNYSSDSLRLERNLIINKLSQLDGEVRMKNSYIDSVRITAQSVDSIRVQYEVKHNAYKDGELRKIKVYPLGSNESKGVFAALPRDTTFTVKLDSIKGKATFYVEADLLDVLLDEIQVLKIYPYECSEQLASKLKALLSEKAILKYRNEKFTNDDLIVKIIKRLEDRQNKDGGWGWWKDSKSSVWITLHVAEAFKLAQQQGYTITLNSTSFVSYLMKVTEEANTETKLRAWIQLSYIQGPVMANAIVDTLQKKHALSTFYLKLLAQQFLQANKFEPDWSFIMKQRHTTLKGNWYWGEERQTLWDNDLDNTLLVYKLMERADSTNINLLHLRNYFLEKRGRQWVNTYQSSRIIETLIPALLREHKHETKPKLVITGGINTDVTRFPFKQEYSGEDLIIQKTGDAPLYLTAYYQFWNSNPKPVRKDFKITTSWSDGETKLNAGKPVTLHVELKVEKDADYVMINIPIPAGCSYDDKTQRRWSIETYREYDVEETRIYCDHLRAGVYSYDIKLLPRYKGHYTINPAKAEWMYFPVVYGRNEMKKVEIR